MQTIRYSLQILMKLEFSRQIFEIYSILKFNKTPFSGSHEDRQTDTQTGKTKLIVGFRNFVNAPKSGNAIKV
jgi:hypothetical protein